MTALDLKPYYATAAQIVKFFRAKGLTLEQACGVLAQADAESSLRPAVVGDHGEARGLFQLHGDRAAAIERGCGVDIANASVEQQCAAAWWELQGPEHRAYRALLASATAYEAGYAMCEFYERPASHLQWSLRGDKAEKWLSYFKAHPAV